MKPNDKSTRASYRFAKKECCIYDKSYYVLNQLCGSRKDIYLLLQHFIQKNQLLQIFGRNIIDGQKTLENIDFFRNLALNQENSENGEFIGPVQFFWSYGQNQDKQENQNENQNEENQQEKQEINKNKNKNQEYSFCLNFFCHPGCNQQIKEEINQSIKNLRINYIQTENNYNLFELIGPESVNKINKLLDNLKIEFQSEKQEKDFQFLKNIFKEINDPNQYPENSVFTFNFQGKISQKMVSIPFNGFFQEFFEEELEEDKILNQTKMQEIQEQNQYVGKLQGILNQRQIQGNQQLQNMGKILQLFQEFNKESSYQFWESLRIKDQEQFDLRYKVTNRSKYTHKKKNKLTKQQKKDVMQQQQQDKMNKFKQGLTEQQQMEEKYKQLVEQQEQEQRQKKIEEKREEQKEQREKEKKDKQFQITFVFNPQPINSTLKKNIEKNQGECYNNQKFCGQNNYNNYGRVQIITPVSQGHIIWKTLNFLVCKAIGLENYNLIMKEQNLKVFPEDYPFSSAYTQLNNQKSKVEAEKYLRRTPGNRVNFKKILSPFPFKSNWDFLINQYFKNLLISQLQDIEEEDQVKNQLEENKQQKNQVEISIEKEDLIEVEIEMVQRGVPEQKSYICWPEKEDLEIYYNLKKLKKPITHIHSENLNLNFENQQQKKLELAEKMSRQIIGFTTSGGFSLNSGKGEGRGYVLKYAVSEYMQKQNEFCQQNNQQDKLLVLVRNVKSLNYFVAKLQII
ncbi:hypothetical protein PPERSA_02057 [Pseudocohnilembus persalinus]|uniref:Uncharacterized protein n=1 Tax=Pseudocohnilembus persalinus TaxID=266149 RepID=A0A0V0QF86_PSEPJ|nr:hypothetical protein PPERSA_02057 [Pseudocohnilembus persalinus]|eukprot:KRX00878.1 hypothetical protein PPERSA_02057 [Pseudocohnilembus persalinus]